MLVKALVSAFVISIITQGCLGCRNPDAADRIIMSFYVNSNQVQVYNVNNFHEILSHPSFVRDRSTVIYHYGFTQTPQTQSVIDVIEAYEQFGNVNFVLVNYASLTTNTLPNACTLGENIAAAIIRFFNGGYDATRLHLIGFSFGATVFGIAGREVMLQSNQEHMIERITGLDPGQVNTLILPLESRLNPGDARFVDTIHTENVGFGDHGAQGHAQYFVNGGVRQPMCTSGINTIAQTCSHLFATSIWIESIQARTPIFPALQCESWDHFLRNDCNTQAPVGNLGVLTSKSLRGSYFLATNLVTPFSRSVPGPVRR